MPTNDPRPTKTQRRDDARAKALQMRQEQERKAKRTRLIAIGGLLAAVLVLGAVVFAIVRQGQANAEAYGDVVFAGGTENTLVPAFDDIDTPDAADETGGIPISAAGVGEAGGDDDVVVEVYFDFMCPWCGKFDAANSGELDALGEQEGVTVVYKNIAFLDGNSQGTFYSTRAANAAAAVAAQDPEHYTAFVTALYANQPEEGTSGLKDARIAEIATEVGVPQTVVDTFTETVDGTYEVATSEDEKESRDGTWRRYAPFVAATTQQAAADLGGLSTPTVLIDGEKWEGDLYTTGPLTQAVLDAVAAKG
ncbi:DsbA family protein [Cellulomonas dongxiuzhuiae]|uniref:Thioredoxin domain-containing protein n=1 Tax=Cellulomonas dongxiuzhuiae TaxID=2819979 RepID=A0ABX8GKQ6_9CELL|nr:thioredoxin domain-containing protein [Cellulomonas dongxiuzhuiae]MBO3088726.1 thioredoxin domain-containing protein [Cellulomonas dongxiuzhuiae]MBO3096284.1 thioredoxin domain-containing protein [Cellulomonas dongxiuzhuiae]QWC16704.1 thioredoxin domain-containing protein [Cellulomonas dongxiuzhuiae]